MKRHRKATERIAELEMLRHDRQSKLQVLERFIQDIETSPLAITEFDEQLWMASVDKVTINADGCLVFRFKDGTEISG